MKILINITIMIIMIISPINCEVRGDMDSESIREIQDIIDNALQESGGNGASIAILMPNGEFLKIVSGISHNDLPIETEMVFSAGSITKLFTSVSILQLAEKKLIGLDDSIGKYIPSFQYIDSTITIRQLLNHTSGIFDFVEHEYIWSKIFSEPDYFFKPIELLNGYINEPYFVKGTGWHYSTTNYILLRMLIEKVSRQSIANYYKENIIEPLNLKNTYLYPFQSLPNNFAHGGWDLDGDGNYDDLSTISMVSFYSATMGGIFCTPEDLVILISALLKERFLLNQESMYQMLTYHSPCPGEEGLIEAYGLGVSVLNSGLLNGNKAIGHLGNAPGYLAACFYLPDEDVCIAIMVNTERGEGIFSINDIISNIIE